MDKTFNPSQLQFFHLWMGMLKVTVLRISYKAYSAWHMVVVQCYNYLSLLFHNLFGMVGLHFVLCSFSISKSLKDVHFNYLDSIRQNMLKSSFKKTFKKCLINICQVNGFLRFILSLVFFKLEICERYLLLFL